MMAFLFAIRLTPIASVMVTAAGRPSGIAPTASATAAMNMLMEPSPRQMPTANVSPASPRIAINRTLLNDAIFLVSGVERSVACAIISEIRPVSVLSPVATMTASAWPYVTSVPA